MKYTGDDAFGSHESADPTAVQKYARNEGDGPNSDNLHLDMHGGHHSVWNQRAFQIIIENYKKALQDESLAPQSDGYLEKMIRERFKRLSESWKKTQPQLNKQGEQETLNGAEERWNEWKDIQLKKARHSTRRRNVS